MGERQLLSFARALALDPRILVLDEATSSVDAEAEAQIQRAIAELMAGRTSLVVAHRLSTILHADEILVMHHGEIRERGTHRELLAARRAVRAAVPAPAPGAGSAEDRVRPTDGMTVLLACSLSRGTFSALEFNHLGPQR